MGWVGPAPVQGREREVSRAAQLLGRDGGSGTALVLTGEPGIGKTTLAHGLLEGLADGVPRLVAAPLGHMATPALWPWRQVLRTLARHRPDGPAARLLPLLDEIAADGRTTGLATVELVVEHLVREALDAPWAAHLEDLQRFDDLSLAVADALCERLPGTPFVLVACLRTDDATPPAVTRFVEAAGRRHRSDVLALAGLSDDALTAALAARAPGLDPARRADAVRLSAGNPLLALELARAYEEGAGSDVAPTPSLTRLVADRARSADEHDVLVALALLGRPATASLLGAACDVPGPTVRRVVERAAGRGLVRVEPGAGRVGFVHPVFGDTVATLVDDDRAQALHRRLADLVTSPGDVAGPGLVERARHLVAAGAGGVTTAHACLAAALHEERVGADGSALGLAAHGLDAAGDDTATRVDLLRVRGRCLARDPSTGDQARAALDAAVTLARRLDDPAAFAHAVHDLATADPQVTRSEPARRALLREALDRTEPAGGPTDALRAGLLTTLVEAHVLLDPDVTQQLADDAEDLAARTTDPQAQAQAIVAVTTATLHLGGTARIEALLRAFDRHGPSVRPLVAVPQAVTALARGDAAAAVDVMTRNLDEPILEPALRRRLVVDMLRMSAAVASGDASDVEQQARRLVASSIPDVAAGAAHMLEIWRLLSGTTVELPSPAAGPAGRSVTQLEPRPQTVQVVMLASVCLPLLAGRRPDPDLVRALATPRATLLDPAPDLQRDLSHATAALAGAVLDDVELCDSATKAFAGFEDRFVTMGLYLLVGPVGWFAAHAHAAAGRVPDALAANAAATAACRRSGFTPWTAACLLQRARLLAHRDPAGGVDLAREALALARTAGLEPLEAAARALVPRSLQRSALSPTQERVLALAADGLTNDRIATELGVTRSTVEKHLSEVYRRLEVPNRAAAVGWWVGRREPSPG